MYLTFSIHNISELDTIKSLFYRWNQCTQKLNNCPMPHNKWSLHKYCLSSFSSHFPKFNQLILIAQTFLQTDRHKRRKKGLPEFPTAPLFTREFGATVRGQRPSWEELGIATGLAAGCAKMMLGSFRPILLGALPGAEWITGPWIGQDGAGIWRGCIGNNPILCMGEYWAGGDWGKLYIGNWTWCGGWAPCWGGPSLGWDPGWDEAWVMAADWEEFCWNGWGWGE